MFSHLGLLILAFLNQKSLFQVEHTNNRLLNGKTAVGKKSLPKTTTVEGESAEKQFFTVRDVRGGERERIAP